jgi:hypothetical protein
MGSRIGSMGTFYVDAFDRCAQDGGIDALAKCGQRAKYTISESGLESRDGAVDENGVVLDLGLCRDRDWLFLLFGLFFPVLLLSFLVCLWLFWLHLDVGHG